MKTSDLLEQDKERLMSRLSKADNVEQARSVLDDELRRIQLMYGESSEDPEINEEAGYALSAIRAAVPLIDSIGEVKTYEHAVSSSDGDFPILPTAGFPVDPYAGRAHRGGCRCGHSLPCGHACREKACEAP